MANGSKSLGLSLANSSHQVIRRHAAVFCMAPHGRQSSFSNAPQSDKYVPDEMKPANDTRIFQFLGLYPAVFLSFTAARKPAYWGPPMQLPQGTPMNIKLQYAGKQKSLPTMPQRCT
jgi:hypothetical protein